MRYLEKSFSIGGLSEKYRENYERIFASVAQLAERPPCKWDAGGSRPPTSPSKEKRNE
jgi:hypothetical protein